MKKEEKKDDLARNRKKERTTAANVAKYGLLIALACVLSFVESLIPVPIGIPGVKLGLANLVTIVSLYVVGIRGTLFVSIVRVLLTGVMFGGLSPMLYSMSGCLVSLLFMISAKKLEIFSVRSISILGGIGHNIGQMAMAVLVLENLSLGYYFGVLMLSGMIAGMVVGLLGEMILKRFVT